MQPDVSGVPQTSSTSTGSGTVLGNGMNWTGALVQGAGLWDQLDRYDDLNKYTQNELGALQEQAVAGSKFTPFTVSGYSGTGSVDSQGNIDQTLDPRLQAQSEQYGAAATNFLGRASNDVATNEQNVFDKMRAMQMPEEQRAMLAQEARGFAQGRGGMTSAQYGGSPEMLAMQKAIGENMNSASVSAIEQARAQQAQDATLSGQFNTNQFLPQAQTSNLVNQGLQASQLQQAGQLGGQNLSTQLGIGKVQSQVNSEKIRAELMAGLFNTIGGATSNGADPLGSVLSKIPGIGGWFD